MTLTCNHIFDKVSMTRTVCVGIMPIFCGIFNMRHINGNSSVPLLGGIINGAIVAELGQGAVLGCQGLGDGGCQGGLAMVNMADCSNIAMGFVTFKNLFSEWETGLNLTIIIKMQKVDTTEDRVAYDTHEVIIEE